MSQVTIYHNPRCSKSRQTLELIKEQGIDPDIREYLKEAPSAAELNQVLISLGISARELLRKNEQEYKDNNLSNPELSDAQIIEVMVANPKLIERPIVFKNGQARIGRPPESVLEIL
ncbi:arsenate reductase (glutaredoxin) [Neptunomonas japonica]|uniref:Arsenate reductase n=1 Tax=Neptunomonas japonica JAMM 1380 TaxID=1441457 RepID=A0A7R6PCG6_9GAMM|nr:arsenate reductase (glutaredoxin) [Neptunomonas japonica]BBB29949.1 arsenate reductase [Neptunomonas japonica JAMM 1380]